MPPSMAEIGNLRCISFCIFGETCACKIKSGSAIIILEQN